MSKANPSTYEIKFSTERNIVNDEAFLKTTFFHSFRSPVQVNKIEIPELMDSRSSYPRRTEKNYIIITTI